MTEQVANTKMAEFWSAYAPTWLALEDHLEAQSGGIGREAMDRLDIRPGHRVLDVGCGSGSTTRELAQRTGSAGLAVGVDIAAEMLDLARQRAAENDVTNVEFLHADAQVDDFGQHAFDRAFSRFGIMFFNDPVAAFANVRRALTPGGRLSFVCFQALEANEWTLVPAQVAMRITGTPAMPQDRERPDPFSLADPERVRRILTDAGYAAIDISARNDVITTNEDDISEVARMRARIGAVARVLANADDATKVRVVDAIEDEFRSRLQDGAVELSRGTLLVTADA